MRGSQGERRDLAQVRRHPRVFAFVSARIDTPTLSPFPILPLARSLAVNGLGDVGVTALAAILKETKITDLKCAAALECSLSWQRPLTHTCSLSLPSPISCSLWGNNIGPKGASTLAAVLKETMISSLKCAAGPECSPFCQRPLTHLHSPFPF